MAHFSMFDRKNLSNFVFVRGAQFRKRAFFIYTVLAGRLASFYTATNFLFSFIQNTDRSRICVR